MSSQLPEFVDLMRLTETGQALKGRVAVANMPRLATALGLSDAGQDAESGLPGEVEADLVFGVDVQGVRNVRGRLHAELHALCQRCLQSMPLTLRVDIALGMARTLEVTEHLSDEYEPLIVPLVNGQWQLQPLASIIEDELLLALPVAPMHAEQCLPWVMPGAATSHALPGTQAETVAADLPPAGKKRPFAGLAQLQQLKKKQ